MLEAVWGLFENVQLDADLRQLIWPGEKPVSFKAAVQRLQKQLPDFPAELIETHLIGWIEMEYVPKDHSKGMLKRFERQIEKWVDELDRQLEARSEKQSRTRHS